MPRIPSELKDVLGRGLGHDREVEWHAVFTEDGLLAVGVADGIDDIRWCEHCLAGLVNAVRDALALGIKAEFRVMKPMGLCLVTNPPKPGEDVQSYLWKLFPHRTGPYCEPGTKSQES